LTVTPPAPRADAYASKENLFSHTAIHDCQNLVPHTNESCVTGTQISGFGFGSDYTCSHPKLLGLGLHSPDPKCADSVCVFAHVMVLRVADYLFHLALLLLCSIMIWGSL